MEIVLNQINYLPVSQGGDSISVALRKLEENSENLKEASLSLEEAIAEISNGAGDNHQHEVLYYLKSEIDSRLHDINYSIITLYAASSNLDARIDSIEELSGASPPDILAAIKTVDGSESGLDADTLDGFHLTDLAIRSEILDSGNKIRVELFPEILLGKMSWQGLWNAATNTPDLASITKEKGFYWVVSEGGNTDYGGITVWNPKDWIVWNGTGWDFVINTDSVISFNGRQGNIEPQSGDYEHSMTNPPPRVIGSTLSTKDKHISNEDATKWEEHLTDNQNPHGITPEQIGAKPSSYAPEWEEITQKPTTFQPSPHNHNAIYPKGNPASPDPGDVWTVDETTGEGAWKPASGSGTGDHTHSTVYPEGDTSNPAAGLFWGFDTATAKGKWMSPPVAGAIDYKGTWNASTNNPDIATISKSNGDYWKISTEGSTDLSGITDWKIGDWAIWNGASFDKIDNSDQVATVEGRQGAVTLTDIYPKGNPSGAANGQVWTYDGTSQLASWKTPTAVPTSASGISNTPAGTISATNVQGAINELDTEKQPAGSYATTTHLHSLQYPPFGFADVVTVRTNPHVFLVRDARTVTEMWTTLGTASTSGNVTFSFRRNGTQVATVTVAQGAVSGVSTGLSVALVVGDLLTVGCTAAGSGAKDATIGLRAA